MKWRSALLLALIVAFSASAARGQAGSASALAERPHPAWVGQFTVLGVNAVLAGLTAGVGQHARGGSFSDGFTRGFLGGTVIYAGKRVAAETFFGAGALGRGVAAAGGSVVWNASEARPALERLILPVGPLRLYIDRTRSAVPLVKLDLNTLIVMGVALAHSELEMDVGRSVSAGAPVFTTERHLFGTVEDTTRASGQVTGNVVFLSELPWRPDREEREIFAHERIHVLQRDQLFVMFSNPIGAEVFGRVPGGPTFSRYFDLHVTDLIFYSLGVVFRDYYDRPWEMEAFHLSGAGARRR